MYARNTFSSATLSYVLTISSIMETYFHIPREHRHLGLISILHSNYIQLMETKVHQYKQQLINSVYNTGMRNDNELHKQEDIVAHLYFVSTKF